jgi:hypothetical protein
MAKKGKITLLASKDKQPSVKLKAGQQLKVTAVVLQGPEAAKIKKVGARLCGGSGTCLALLDIGDDVINPAPRG